VLLLPLGLARPVQAGSELNHRLDGKTAGLARLFTFAMLPFPAGVLRDEWVL